MASENGQNSNEISGDGTTANGGLGFRPITRESLSSSGEAGRLILELSKVSQALDPQLTSEWMTKRLLFFSYELQARTPFDANEKEKLALLNQFFFAEKRFKRVPSKNEFEDLSDPYRLGYAVATRAGSASVLAVIYAFLAESIGIRLDFVDLKPSSFLKWNKLSSTKDEDGNFKPRSCYIDITRSGAILSDVDLIETLHERFQIHSISHASLLEAYVFETYFCDYLLDLRAALTTSACDPELLLFISNSLIEHQPNNLQLVAERALLHRRIGNFKSALSDLKRYFAFHERELASIELNELYDELVVLLERTNPGSPTV